MESLPVVIDVDISSESESSDDDEVVLAALTFGKRKNIEKVRGYLETCNRMHKETFRSHFRLSVECYEKVFPRVAERLNEMDENSYCGHPTLPKDAYLLMTLWLLATKDSFRSVGDRFGTSKSVAHRVFLKVCDVLASLAHVYLRWPNEEEIASIVHKFDNLRRNNAFPNILGAIDGTHIEIPAPKEDAQSYFNRKSFHSIVVQGICDSEMKFIDIFAGWPGSSHDSRVWRRSPVCEAISNRNIIPDGLHLIGDSAYPLSRYLMTPFKDNGHLTRIQRRFNRKLSSKRVVIEQAFGLLKGRFQRFKFLDMRLVSHMSTVVIAACVLHNICIMNGDVWANPRVPNEIDNDNNNNPDDENEMIGQEVEGTVKRNEIANLL